MSALNVSMIKSVYYVENVFLYVLCDYIYFDTSRTEHPYTIIVTMLHNPTGKTDIIATKEHQFLQYL